VIPAFNARFLFRFYRRFLASEFAGHDLLAIFPLEPHLTRAFERTPFLTTVYPTSQLATKTRLLLCGLLGEAAADRLPAAIRCPSRFSRPCHAYYMGRWPRILELDFIFRSFIAVAMVVLVLVPLASRANKAMPNAMLATLAELPQVRVDGKLLVDIISTIYFPFWIVLALGTKWFRDLDIWMTYAIRTRSAVPAVGGAIALLCFCALWAGGCYSLAKSAWGPGSPFSRVTSGVALGILSVPVGWFLFNSARRGVQGIWLDRRRLEGGFRLALSTVLPAAAIVLAWLFP
jgi:hypothetical protein